MKRIQTANKWWMMMKMWITCPRPLTGNPLPFRRSKKVRLADSNRSMRHLRSHHKLSQKMKKRKRMSHLICSTKHLLNTLTSTSSRNCKLKWSKKKIKKLKVSTLIQNSPTLVTLFLTKIEARMISSRKWNGSQLEKSLEITTASYLKIMKSSVQMPSSRVSSETATSCQALLLWLSGRRECANSLWPTNRLKMEST